MNWRTARSSSSSMQKLKKIYPAVSEIGPHNNGTATRFRLRLWRICDVMDDAIVRDIT